MEIVERHHRRKVDAPSGTALMLADAAKSALHRVGQVVLEGQRKLDSQRVPAAFRGLPVALLYIGILALAIYGFTGHTVTF